MKKIINILPKSPLGVVSITIILTILIIFSCKKDHPEPPAGLTNKITIQTDSISNISYRNACVYSFITRLGGKNITRHGHCWDTVETLQCNVSTGGGAFTQLGALKAPGIFTSQLTNLEPNTQYYVKGYIQFDDITLYTEQDSFITKALCPPTVVTLQATEVTESSAKTGGNITDDGGLEIIEKGICWGESQNTDLSGIYITDTSNNTYFIITITGLSPNITYYVRAYAINNIDTAYGNEISFTTGCTSPSITSQPNGQQKCEGESVTFSVTAAGTGLTYQWRKNGSNISGATYSSYTISSVSTSDAADYTCYITGTCGNVISDEATLTVNTAPAITSHPSNQTIGFGGNTSFSVTATGTNLIYQWQENNGSGWNNISNGGSNPAYSGANTVTLTLTNVPESYDSYDYRCVVSGICSPSATSNSANLTVTFICGTSTVTDVDGNVYNTVQIGTQCWMAENLNVGTMINSTAGGQLQTNNGVIEKYCYDNNSAKCDIYGGLYEWDEMMQYAPSDNGTIGTTQGICPTGWHIPTDIEWTTLTDELSGQSVAGGKLKETGTTHWYSPNTGATNESGFTALPGGGRSSSDGSFYALRSGGYWWSATETSSTRAWERGLGYSGAGVGRYDNIKVCSQSVRCLQD